MELLLAEHSPRVEQIWGIKTLAEPTVNITEDSVGLRLLPGAAPKPVQAHRRAELEGFCAVGLCPLDGGCEAALGLLEISARFDSPG